MRATTAPPVQQYACACGQGHPAYARLQGTALVLCPELEGDDTLRVILGTPIVLRTGRK